jgi:serine/threonine-protein kinase HSL1 (negative regulator of Swe1 kinase)
MLYHWFTLIRLRYLVLEFVDNGELFEHITAKGRLSEEEAMRYFRQILSAVGYCHSFNICHRDLKPENILLTKEGEIKIADFGMAALHQGPNHQLKTSCGSPHYAAPELIRGAKYRGDKVDIWSMGVILYATLAGRLPFDVEGTGRDWLGPLLSKIRRGNYEMAPEFSEEAKGLIHRILQVDPRHRIDLAQIWRHPLLRKYDYLDDLGKGKQPISPTIKDCGRPVMRRSEINKELLRHMRSLWHQYTEQQLLDALLSEEYVLNYFRSVHHSKTHTNTAIQA